MIARTSGPALTPWPQFLQSHLDALQLAGVCASGVPLTQPSVSCAPLMAQETIQGVGRLGQENGLR